MKNKLLKNFLYKLSIVVYIVAIFNVPICDLTCEFSYPEIVISQECHHKNHHQNHTIDNHSKNHNHDILCDFLHSNADEYLKYNSLLFFISQFSLETFVFIIKKIEFIYINFIFQTIPKFILFCSQLK